MILWFLLVTVLAGSINCNVEEIISAEVPVKKTDPCAELGPVRELGIWIRNFRLSADWLPPENSEDCEITYRLTYDSSFRNENPLEIYTKLTIIHFNETLIPCSYIAVTITPVGTADGQTTSIPHRVQPAALKAPILKTLAVGTSTARFSWQSQPREENNCTISKSQLVCFSDSHNVTGNYLVTDNDKRYFQSSITGLLPDETYTCYGNLFVSRAGHSSDSESVTFNTTLGAVENFTLTLTKTGLRAEWAPPLVLNDSVLSYEVIVENSEIGQRKYEVLDLYFTFDADIIPCLQTTIIVTPISNSTQRGRPSELSNTPPLTELGPIRNIEFTLTNVSWERPQNAGKCLIFYNLLIVDEFNTFPTITSQTTYNYNVIPCGPIDIHVTPLYNITRRLVGPTESVNSVGPSKALNAPIHLLTVPLRNGANISLQADPREENSCTINYVYLNCSYIPRSLTDELLPIFDDRSHITVSLTNVSENTVFNCTARWTIAEADLPSEESEAFSFTTRPLITKNLTIFNVTSNELSVQWVEDYDPNFVLGYRIIIESLGPRHFIPESCAVVRNYTYIYDLSPSERNFTFREGLPNYDYRVTVLTSYNLGPSISRSYTSQVQTLRAAPGEIDDLSYTWKNGSVEQYNISGVISWSIPCDINDDLRFFEVEFNTHLTLQEKIIWPQFFLITPNDPEDGYYTLTWNDVNPFHKYDVKVTLQTAKLGRPAQLQEITPPEACNCI